MSLPAVGDSGGITAEFADWVNQVCAAAVPMPGSTEHVTIAPCPLCDTPGAAVTLEPGHVSWECIARPCTAKRSLFEGLIL